MSSGRRGAILAGSAGCLLLLGAGADDRTPRLLFNTTSSVPVGFYTVDGKAPEVGDLAVVQPPRSLAVWMANRHYLPMHVPLLKEVAATGGAHVCAENDVVSIDGHQVGRVRPRDRIGRPLVAFAECRRLAGDEIFLFNTDAAASLDSRYFGPVRRSAVVGRARALWTWER